MNYIQADNGNWAIAEGAPGSVARVRVQHPVLIETLRTMKRLGASQAEAYATCVRVGVSSGVEYNSILKVADFQPQPEYSI